MSNSQPWESLGIKRAWYYRLKSRGELDALIIRTTGGHSVHTEDWIAWRESGLEMKVWSETYKYMLRLYLKSYFNSYPVIASDHLKEWLSTVSMAQRSKRLHMFLAVSSMAKYLHSAGVIPAEEYLKIKGSCPKKDPYYQYNQRIIYKEDLEAILESADGGHVAYQRLLNRTMIVFLSETALRVSEMCNLSLSDLRFSENPKEACVIVRKGKGGKGRMVPFSKVAQSAVREYLKVRPEGIDSQSTLLAFNPKHGYTPLNKDCVCHRFKRISEEAGKEFSAHSLRHYRITIWANEPRIPITVTQKWAGHSSLEITQRYVHIRDEDALKAAFG